MVPSFNAAAISGNRSAKSCDNRNAAVACADVVRTDCRTPSTTDSAARSRARCNRCNRAPANCASVSATSAINSTNRDSSEASSPSEAAASQTAATCR